MVSRLLPQCPPACRSEGSVNPRRVIFFASRGRRRGYRTVACGCSCAAARRAPCAPAGGGRGWRHYGYPVYGYPFMAAFYRSAYFYDPILVGLRRLSVSALPVSTLRVWVCDSSSDLRVQVNPKQAEVYVDGYLTGNVDDFDGVFQRLRLPPGEHEVTIYAQGYRSITQRMLFRPFESYTIKDTLQPAAAGDAAEPRPTPSSRTQPSTARVPGSGRTTLASIAPPIVTRIAEAIGLARLPSGCSPRMPR